MSAATTAAVGDERVTHVSDVIGDFGKWQLNICLFCTTMAMFSSLNNLAASFYAPKINYWCVELKNGSTLNISDTEEVCKSEQECLKWAFDDSIFQTTIINEWNLICDRSYYASATQSVYMGGITISALVFGYLSDRFGRLPSMWISVITEIIAGFSSAFSTSILVFTVARFFVAFGCYGRNLTSFLLGLESVGTKYRAITGIAYQFGWATGYVLLPGIAYVTRNFRYMMIVTTIPEILWLFWLWKVPESIRWQLTNGKSEAAKKAINEAIALNRLSRNGVNEKFAALKRTVENENKQKELEKSSLIELWRRPKIRQYTLVFYYTWLVNAFVYYGISLNIADFGGNLFQSFVIAGLVEFPAYVICIIAFKYIGRKKLTATAMFGCGASLLLILPFTFVKNSVATTVLTMCGKFFTTSSFAIIYVYSAEVYPTIVRQIGVGSCSVAGRLGSILAPFVKEMSHFTAPWLSLGIFGALSLSDSFLVLLLPETMHREIPDTFNETTKFNKLSEVLRMTINFDNF